MTDREYLELAAKAAGWFAQNWAWLKGEGFVYRVDGRKMVWNPLTDDGDALRLAVKLQLQVIPQEKCCYVQSNPETLLGMAAIAELEINGNDPFAATRRAIVRAAAEIGKGMK